jgi:uncharacterized small protein (DUF1192 family)
MLSDAQLDDVKSKLEGGRTLQDIVSNDYSGERVYKVRDQLIDKFTREVIMPIIHNARLSQLSVDDLNVRISAMQARLNDIIAIRDSKL